MISLQRFFRMPTVTFLYKLSFNRIVNWQLPITADSIEVSAIETLCEEWVGGMLSFLKALSLMKLSELQESIKASMFWSLTVTDTDAWRRLGGQAAVMAQRVGE